MTRAGVVVAALATLGMGAGMFGTAAAPAEAAQTAVSNGQPAPTIVEALSNTEALVSTLEAEGGSYVALAESLACFPLELLLDAGPPYPPPGSCDIGQR